MTNVSYTAGRNHLEDVTFFTLFLLVLLMGSVCLIGALS